MTRTAAIIQAELAAVEHEIAAVMVTWTDSTAAPPAALGDLLLRRDGLSGEALGEDAP